ncbi:S41 family peptidase [Sediminibacterium soli]|uniref:S41 family peptidase n=1 Tax=Sediminibacterium soli TaxID=2698829 RepID=UPI00137A904F|nr:S41 family peptidase [Sediminibacterium soli]NCI47847.1 peptidase S41 [Sediminibacterium soli]
MKSCRSLVLWVCLLLVNGSHAQGKPAILPKLPPAALRDDLSLLQKILEANHPSLYWYTTKDSLDAVFATAIGSISDSMDEVAFKNKVAYVISHIRCGHTTVRFSKSYLKKAARFRYPMFPLQLKAWDDSLVVLASAVPNDPVFKRGTVITGINGRNNRSLLDTLFRYMSTDGYSVNFKNQVLSGNFPAWYKTVLGLDSVYAISYIDSTGRENMAQLKNFSPVIDLSKKEPRNLPAVQRPTRRQLRKAGLLEKRSLVIDTANSTAYMRLTTFSTGNLRSFFRSSFRSMEKEHIRNLVIDLRENGGGKVRNSILLSSYLADHPFKVGDSVVALSRKFRYGRYIKPSWVYWFAMNFGARKMEDGKIHIRRYETHLFTPSDRYHFGGNIYLFQGGYTFSAATMFLSNLKGQKNVTTIGEETGGGYYGNSAMHIPTIVLPNTGIQVSLPMYRLVMDAGREKGHGFLPDIEIKPSSDAIRQGLDLKLLKVRELIGSQKQP